MLITNVLLGLCCAGVFILLAALFRSRGDSSDARAAQALIDVIAHGSVVPREEPPPGCSAADADSFMIVLNSTALHTALVAAGLTMQLRNGAELGAGSARLGKWKRQSL